MGIVALCAEGCTKAGGRLISMLKSPTHILRPACCDCTDHGKPQAMYLASSSGSCVAGSCTIAAVSLYRLTTCCT